MRFSIIIPAHNVEEYISKALSSVKSQVFSDYECIVVCDACTDKTEDIVHSYPFNVRIVHYQSAGLTRNVGLDLAQGEYILFLDADDWYLHEYVLSEINNRLGDEDIFCFGFIWKGVGYAGPTNPEGRLYPHVWNKCFKRSFIGNLRFPDATDEDACFHEAIMKQEPKIEMCDAPMIYYNFLREGSTSKKLQRTVQGAKSWWHI